LGDFLGDILKNLGDIFSQPSGHTACIIPPTIHHKKQNIFILYQMKVPLGRQR
jgi:hypothetical protein